VMKRNFFLLICFAILICAGYSVKAQDVVFSSPEKITPGSAHVEVLGKNSEGIIVYQNDHGDDFLTAYYDNMEVHWRRPINKSKHLEHVNEIFLTGDSIWLFHSYTQKNTLYIFSYWMSAKGQLISSPRIIDSLSGIFMNGVPKVNFLLSPDKKSVLWYFADPGFEDNHIVHAGCLSASLSNSWKVKIKVEQMQTPGLLDAELDNHMQAYLLFGNQNQKSPQNDFYYDELHLTAIQGHAEKVNQYVLVKGQHLFSNTTSELDLHHHRIVVGGLFATNPGEVDDGIFVLNFDYQTDSVVSHYFENFEAGFSAQLADPNDKSKPGGVVDFLPRQIIPRADGGAIVIAEQVSTEMESYANQPFGMFSLNNALTVNYFDFNDIIIFSITSTGDIEWKSVIRKSQQTQDDGGFYSSFTTMITADDLYFVYNSNDHGEINVVSHQVGSTGMTQRNVLFSADRKGVMLVPKFGKQVSSAELVIPSLKRNYLQLVKVSFH
jgi:hypothetical protein